MHQGLGVFSKKWKAYLDLKQQLYIKSEIGVSSVMCKGSGGTEFFISYIMKWDWFPWKVKGQRKGFTLSRSEGVWISKAPGCSLKEHICASKRRKRWKSSHRKKASVRLTGKAKRMEWSGMEWERPLISLSSINLVQQDFIFPCAQCLKYPWCSDLRVAQRETLSFFYVAFDLLSPPSL